MPAPSVRPKPAWSPEDFRDLARAIRDLEAVPAHVAPVIDIRTRERVA